MGENENVVTERICKIVHGQVRDKFDEHDKRFDEHGERIVVLEKSDAKKEEKIDNLCGQISGLTKAIWGMVGSVFLILIGFVVWYVETIPRR